MYGRAVGQTKMYIHVSSGLAPSRLIAGSDYRIRSIGSGVARLQGQRGSL